MVTLQVSYESRCSLNKFHHTTIVCKYFSYERRKVDSLVVLLFLTDCSDVEM